MSYTPDPPEPLHPWPPRPRPPVRILGIVTAVLAVISGLMLVGVFIAFAFSIGLVGTKG